MNTVEKIWRQATLPNNSSIQEAITNLEQVAIKIVLVVNDLGEFEGTISDGDIRRGLLKGLDLNSPITSVIHKHSLVVPPDVGREMILQLMLVNKIQQIPIVDDAHKIVGLHIWDEITSTPARSNTMIIMAGGMGTRLRPHTENCPKPLLPVAGKPMLEHIIERAKSEGFTHFIIAIHYLGHMIEDYFKDGKHLGVTIEYLREESPLGTAGALSLLNPYPNKPFVVTNGDVMTDIRYGELLDYHTRQDSIATMAVRAYEWQHPFGVVQTEGVDIIGFDEKPVHRSYINAGIYVLEPQALAVLKTDVYCDMPTLFEQITSLEKRTVVYPMYEPWLDVGRPEDLQSANGQDKVTEKDLE